MRVGLLAYAFLFTPAPGSLLLFYCAVVSEWLLPFVGPARPGRQGLEFRQFTVELNSISLQGGEEGWSKKFRNTCTDRWARGVCGPAKGSKGNEIYDLPVQSVLCSNAAAFPKFHLRSFFG